MKLHNEENEDQGDHVDVSGPVRFPIAVELRGQPQPGISPPCNILAYQEIAGRGPSNRGIMISFVFECLSMISSSIN